MTLDELANLFARMPAKLEEAEHHALEKIGEHVEKVAKEMLGHDQGGWAPLSPETIADKEKKGLPVPSPLLRTGEHVKDTIHHHVTGHTKVQIGSDSEVAKWQEEGTSKIPPRPFLAKAAMHEEHRIKEIIEHAVVATLGGGIVSAFE